MSDLIINIRIWNWHWQVTLTGNSSWSKNKNIEIKDFWYKPIWICELRIKEIFKWIFNGLRLKEK